MLIHHLIEAQVERSPEAIAVVFDEDQLTYRELDDRANQLARHLQTLGVTSDVLVGLCVERSITMLVGLLGILKAGGAYVPLDPKYPRDRIAHILADSQAPLLITEQSLVSNLPDHTAQVLCLDTAWNQIETEDTANLQPTIQADNLAYVIYTSGSTGKPKGVQIEHRSLVNFLASMQTAPGLQTSDVMVAVTTICFDIAALELYLPLITGARVVIASTDVAADGKQLSQTLAATNATIMQGTPATWKMLLSSGWKGHTQFKVLCGGEALPRSLAQILQANAKSVWNLYGPTEATVWASVAQIHEQANDRIGDAHQDKNTPNRDDLEPIGLPIANTQLYILDTSLQPVPVGIPGELHIGGHGLARGYLNRPELTQQRFIPNPFSNVSGSRLYKTGDLARSCPDGSIEWLGRLDHQIKLRGFRIELGEIEANLGQHPAIQGGVVMVREDNPGDQRLVAYYVAQDAIPSTTLRDFLKTQLPDYMVPSAFVLVSQSFRHSLKVVKLATA